MPRRAPPGVASACAVMAVCACVLARPACAHTGPEVPIGSDGAAAAPRACVDEGVEGRCVPPERCFSTNPYIQGIVHPPNCTLAEGAHGVCCTDCELVANASDAVLDGRGEMFWKSGDKSFDKCIEWLQKLTYFCHFKSYLRRELTRRPVAGVAGAADNATRACRDYSLHGIAPVGGQDVFRGEFPHMVLLVYRKSQSPLEWYCSGAIISERFVLTAAHCLASSLGPVTEVAAGGLRRSDPPTAWARYAVARAVPHPEYRPPAKYHDIALLETELPVQFVNDVRPACLPARVGPGDYVSGDVTATGWGALGHHRPLADTLQKVYLEQFSAAECDAQYPPHRHLRDGINQTTQMCYGHHKEVRDTCGGDSGGALQRDTQAPACVSTLLGVTSFGRQCGADRAPAAGVYTRVQHYLPWIEAIVWA